MACAEYLTPTTKSEVGLEHPDSFEGVRVPEKSRRPGSGGQGWVVEAKPLVPGLCRKQNDAPRRAVSSSRWSRASPSTSTPLRAVGSRGEPRTSPIWTTPSAGDAEFAAQRRLDELLRLHAGVQWGGAPTTFAPVATPGRSPSKIWGGGHATGEPVQQSPCLKGSSGNESKKLRNTSQWTAIGHAGLLR